MCDFCKNLVKIEESFSDAICKGDDFIFEDEGKIYLYINTGDSGLPGTMKINFCPMCGRKLVDE